MRSEQTGISQRHLTPRGGQRGHLGNRRADLRTQVCHRVEVDMQVPAHPSGGEFHDPAQPAAPSAEELRDGVGAPQIEVGVVLPGDADPAQHLDAVFGVILRRPDPRRRRDSRRQRQLLVDITPCRRGRIRSRDRDLLGTQQHLSAEVLDSLETADRPAELLSYFGVFGG